MDVPGLSGSSYERQKQYYEKMGSPKGPYTGSLDQNMWLLGQLNQPNYGLPQQQAPVAQPAPTPAPAPVAQPTLAEQITKPLEKQVYTGPMFTEVLPYAESWGSLKPFVEQQAAEQVNPYVNRQYNADMRNYYSNLANTGGWRSGRAVGEQGNVWAEAERNRKALTQDWLNSGEQAYQNYWNQAQDTWRNAIDLGQQNVKIPTWQELAKQLGYTTGNNPYSISYKPLPFTVNRGTSVTGGFMPIS